MPGMTSPPAMVTSDCQTTLLTFWLMKCTEPSPNRVLTPPVCRLREAAVLLLVPSAAVLRYSWASSGVSSGLGLNG